MVSVNVFWFRRDLRYDDNCGLYHALNSGLPVLPVFIFDTNILTHLTNTNDPRITFIYQEIEKLKKHFERVGSSLLVFHDTPERVLQMLYHRYSIQSVFTNVDYEPEAIKRDQKVSDFLNERGISFMSYKDQVIFHQNEVVKPDGKPYTVFTPYSKKWKEKYQQQTPVFFESEKLLYHLLPLQKVYLPTMFQLGYRFSKTDFPNREVTELQLRKYAEWRDFPAVEGTTRLGIHLRFGTISIRKLTEKAVHNSEVFLNELIWRNFYMDILWHFPEVVNRSFKAGYDYILWRNNEQEFESWCKGETGYPMVDAGMRQLNETGYMHNRLRMVTASFLTKHLLIDWRWGETYFAQKLHDYELASNNGGWQWAAGTGCDAAPYFRVFNPDLQAKKFDAERKYIKKWVPEVDSPGYENPMVDHAYARKRAIDTYRRFLAKK